MSARICGAPLARGGECPLPARHPGPCDPVGLNPTGRPRRSSAGSRRRHAKRAGRRHAKRAGGEG